MPPVESLPETILEIVRKEAEAHPDDINAALQSAERRIRKLSEFEDLVNQLVSSAIRHLIHDAREAENRKQRRAAGGPPIVNVGNCDDVLAVCEQKAWMDYFIAGRTLGSITGEELPGIAESERQKASGHSWNAALCKDIAKRVPAERQVREVLTEKQLANAVERISKKLAAA